MNPKNIRRKLKVMAPGTRWELPVGTSGGLFICRTKDRWSVISAQTFAPVPFPRSDTRCLGVELSATKAVAVISEFIAD